MQDIHGGKFEEAFEDVRSVIQKGELQARKLPVVGNRGLIGFLAPRPAQWALQDSGVRDGRGGSRPARTVVLGAVDGKKKVLPEIEIAATRFSTDRTPHSADADTVPDS